MIPISASSDELWKQASCYTATSWKGDHTRSTILVCLYQVLDKGTAHAQLRALNPYLLRWSRLMEPLFQRNQGVREAVAL